jgi:hypothetical protein
MPSTTAGPARSPLTRFRSGEHRGLAGGIDDRKLASGFRPRLIAIAGVGIAIPDLLHDVGGLQALAQQLESLRAIADIHNRLGRGRAHAGLGPEHAVADREHARLHRAAEFTRLRIKPEDRKRGDGIFGQRSLL